MNNWPKTQFLTKSKKNFLQLFKKRNPLPYLVKNQDGSNPFLIFLITDPQLPFVQTLSTSLQSPLDIYLFLKFYIQKICSFYTTSLSKQCHHASERFIMHEKMTFWLEGNIFDNITELCLTNA